jgi:iron complex outermembrane receptor protein
MTNAYNATDGDVRKLQQFSGHFDAAFSDNLDMMAKAYFNRTRDDRFVKFSAGRRAAKRRVTNEDHWGALAAVHYHADARRHAADAGSRAATLQKQDNESLRFLAVNRVPTSSDARPEDEAGLSAASICKLSWSRPTG